jgi:predicted CxxxxCH...CXXCH cytochrome family protein
VDLEFVADGTWKAGGEDIPGNDGWSGHGKVAYSSVDNYATKATNECKKCHGSTHPSSGAKVQKADGTTAYPAGFVYGLSFDAQTGWAANPASFQDANPPNGVIDGNEFCLSCHGTVADDASNDNVKIGGRRPPKVYFPDGGGPSGHDRGGTAYSSGNPAAQQLCTTCHKYHVSDRPKLLPGTATYGNGAGFSYYTYAMPTWAGITDAWQAPKPFSSVYPSRGGRIVIGSRDANLVSYSDRSKPPSGRTFGNPPAPWGTAGSSKTAYDGLCDACHRDPGPSSFAVSPSTRNRSHTHEGDNTAFGSRNQFAKDCLECHNPHGGGPVPNRSMIRETVGRDNNSQATVVFTASTGADSYDEEDAVAGPTQNLDDLCATCHSGPSPIAHNYRAEQGTGSHNQGKNCITCHAHGAPDNVDRFGFVPLACNGCHTYPGLPTVSGTYRLSAVHDNHAGRPGDEAAIPNRGYDCAKCHNGSDHNTAGIADKSQWSQVVPGVHVQVRFDPFNPAAAAGNPANVRLSSTSYDNGTKTCNALYCHGTTLAGAGGSRTTPAWDNALSGRCGTCHDTGTGDSTPGTVIGTGKHAPHLTAPYGPAVTCDGCHPSYSANSVYHVNAAKEFQNDNTQVAQASVLGATAPSGAPDGTSTDRCNGCHSTAAVGGSAGAVLAKLNWSAAGYRLPCLNCHNGSDPAWDNAGKVGVRAPAKDANWATSGHGKPSGTYNQTNNPAPNPAMACTTCHDADKPHISHQLADAARLRSPAAENPPLAYTDNTSELCLDCHRVGQTAAGSLGYNATRKASVHSTGVTGKYNALPATFRTYGDNANFPQFPGYQCAACHDPHGTARLAMVAESIAGGIGDNTPRPVTAAFNYTGGTLAGGLDPTSAANDGVCDLCHGTGTANPHPDTAHPNNHNWGNSCVACHDHGRSFQGSCTGCHGNTGNGSWWPDSAPEHGTAYPNRLGAHQKHVDAIYNGNASWLQGATATDKKNQTCAWCHPGPGGIRPGTTETGHSDNVAPAGTADLHRDGRAGASPTFFRKIDNTADAAGTFSPSAHTCSGLSCHGGGASPDWYAVSDSAAPVWTPDSGISASNPNVGGTLTATWRPAVDAFPSNPVLYDLYVSDNAAAVFAGAPAYAGLQDNTATVTGLANGTTYFFGVRAKDSWPVPNVTTNTDVSAGVAPTGAGGGVQKTYYLQRSNGANLWGTTNTSLGTACGTAATNLTVSTATAPPPPGRGLLATSRNCATASANNYMASNTTAWNNVYRFFGGFYLAPYASPTVVTGSATGNSFGFQASTANSESVLIQFAAVNSAGTHTLSADNVVVTLTSTTMTPYTPDLSSLSIAVPSGSRFAVIFQFRDANSGSNLHRIAYDNVSASILNTLSVTEAPYDNTAPAFAGGTSGIQVGDAGTGGTLNIRWNTAVDGGTPNTPPVLYDLYRSADNASVFASVYKAGLGATSYQDTGLSNGTTYWYGVRARDSAVPPNSTANVDFKGAAPTKGSAFGCNSCHASPPADAGNAGSHAKHVSPGPAAAGIYTDCDRCHPGTSSYTNSHQDGVGQLGFAGVAYNAIYGSPTATTLRYNNGTADFYVDGNGYGTLTGSAGDNVDNGTCSNTGCHGTVTPVWGSSGSVTCGSCHSNGAAVTPNAPTVTGTGTHVDADGTGTTWTAGDCKGCHSGHTQGVQVPLPPTNWSNANLPATNMRTALGLNYSTVDGIYLGGPGTAASINAKTTEAEICWGCHDALAAPVSEFGFNTNTLPAGFPVVADTTFVTNGDTKGTGQGGFNYGWLFTSGTFATKTSNWVAGGADGTPNPAWRSPYDNTLTMRVVSVHTASFDSAGQSSSVAKNIDAGGNVRYTTATLEDRKYIRCSYCHDVHSLGRNGYTPAGKPYLRGAWIGNPYPPDIPPRSTYSYPATGGPNNLNIGNRYFTGQTAMPRVYADNPLNDTTSSSRGKGGYFIDQNSNAPGTNAAMNTSAKVGGLCLICHGTNVNTMDMYPNSSTTMWRFATRNGHSNSTVDGTGTNRSDLFDARRGMTQNYMALQGQQGVNNPAGNDPGGTTDWPWGQPLNQPGTMPNSGWYSPNSAGTTTANNTADYNSWYAAGAFGQWTGNPSSKPHNFPCSKCHSPHATGLPALLISNCLDRTLATWTANGGAVGPNGTLSQNTTTNNCHRKDSGTPGNSGWHRLNAGQKWP